MSFTFKQLYFGMFNLFVMSGQFKKILAGQVYKRISGQLKENMHYFFTLFNNSRSKVYLTVLFLRALLRI